MTIATTAATSPIIESSSVPALRGRSMPKSSHSAGGGDGVVGAGYQGQPFWVLGGEGGGTAERRLEVGFHFGRQSRRLAEASQLRCGAGPGAGAAVAGQ